MEAAMTAEPEAFRSYYGRPVLKPPVWEWKIPAYLFAGGLSAGSALLAAGADLTGRPALRRTGRLAGLASVLASTYFLIADLGRPERFHYMLRVAKPSSPMSIGTWILAGYGPAIGLAAAGEAAGLLPASARTSLPGRLLGSRLVTGAARPAGLAAAALAPGLASYTAALLAQTAVPVWHEARRELPFVFTGSAAASGGAVAMIAVPAAEAAPARRLAAAGAATELAAAWLIDHRPGVLTEAWETGRAHRMRRLSQILTLGGGLTALTAARTSRAAGVAAGVSLLAGAALQRFGTFEAGVISTKDPKYTVVPQRQRRPAATASSPG
jgi:formate-dependent nitrite reductase membrane component NrfD